MHVWRHKSKLWCSSSLRLYPRQKPHPLNYCIYQEQSSITTPKQKLSLGAWIFFFFFKHYRVNNENNKNEHSINTEVGRPLPGSNHSMREASLVLWEQPWGLFASALKFCTHAPSSAVLKKLPLIIVDLCSQHLMGRFTGQRWFTVCFLLSVFLFLANQSKRRIWLDYHQPPYRTICFDSCCYPVDFKANPQCHLYKLW